tara:strand:- start:3743 stop:3946 length:204 start_codon:yes stop_codon:yes gene_type:complete
MQTPTHPALIEAYNKTHTTVKSCKTKKQLEAAFNMVKNFKEMYKEVGYPKTLSYSLDRALIKQIEKI